MIKVNEKCEINDEKLKISLRYLNNFKKRND